MSTKVFHRFLRQPNLPSSIQNRIGNRYDPFNNTLTILKDPASNRELYLIGTTNSSTTLAHRTKKLLDQIKPSFVYVQASNTWWNVAQHVQTQNQQSFRSISRVFPQEQFNHQLNPRGILWLLRYYIWMAQMHLFLCFPQTFTPFTPGLEIKYALDGATKHNSKIIFGGIQLDPTTIQALRTQTRMYFHTVLWKARKLYRFESAWTSQFRDFRKVLATRGGQAFAQSMDRSRINFMVALLSKCAPQQKKILVDLRDQTIFKDLYRQCRSQHGGDKIVAVVNQWHMQGIETHWRRATKTQILKQELSPIADMDIDQYQERHIINEYLRDFTSKLCNSQPATHQDALTNYHEENYQFERTRHTHHRSHQDIPAPGEEKKKNHH